MGFFTLIQRLRNKIKIKGENNIIKLKNRNNLKIVNSRIYIKGNNNKLIIKNNVIIRNSIIEIIGNNCTIIIGNNCMIGHDCYLSAKEENITLSIDDNCGLSRNVKVMTSDGHPIFQNDKRINEAKDIIISNNVWIGDNVTILKNVNIGSNSVLGINSLVTKNVPNNCVVAGNPARVIKENITWEP